MKVQTISEINEYSGENINPINFPDQQFELYSVPSFESGYPEIIYGREIGSSKQKVQKDDVLICKINPRINRVWKVTQYTDKPLIASSEWIVVRNSTIDSDYLRWYFSSDNFRKLLTSQVAGIGGSLTRAQPKQVKQYKIPIPDYEDQKRIASVLDKVSDLIALRKHQLDKLDKLVKARFMEMFGDPAVNPMKWPLVPLLEMGDCKNGMNFHNGDSGIEIYCLGVGDFKDLSAIHDISKLSKVSLNEMPSNDYLLKNEDIVFVRSNGNKALVGRCLAVYPGDTLTTFSGFCIRYRRFSEIIQTAYLLQVLKSNSMRKKMAGRGANIQNLNQQILASLTIPIPPQGLQCQFASVVNQIEKNRLTIGHGLDKLETVKKALMQEYFGGEINEPRHYN